MSYVERPVLFDCEGERLVGVIAVPEQAARVAVLVVVGGPQYRAGSHRQFVRLARALAADGFPAMRFDYRGMGDSTGAARTFEDCRPDIAAAVAALRANCPDVERIVLWGLCDAASAALDYWHEARDPVIAGMVLLNPWVRSETTLAKAHIKHYYGRRLLAKEFWAKLLSGGVKPVDDRAHVRPQPADLTRASRAGRDRRGARVSGPDGHGAAGVSGCRAAHPERRRPDRQGIPGVRAVRREMAGIAASRGASSGTTSRAPITRFPRAMRRARSSRARSPGSAHPWLPERDEASVLMMAYHFPPLAGSSGIQRTLRFVQQLPEFGWEPIVLTAHPRAYERTSDDLLREVPAGSPVDARIRARHGASPRDRRTLSGLPRASRSLDDVALRRRSRRPRAHSEAPAAGRLVDLPDCDRARDRRCAVAPHRPAVGRRLPGSDGTGRLSGRSGHVAKLQDDRGAGRRRGAPQRLHDPRRGARISSTVPRTPPIGSSSSRTDSTRKASPDSSSTRRASPCAPAPSRSCTAASSIPRSAIRRNSLRPSRGWSRPATFAPAS